MLIKIDDSVGEFLKNTNLEEDNKYLIKIFNNLAKTNSEGNHIVTGSFNTIKIIKNLESLDVSSRLTFEVIFNKISTNGRYETLVSDYILLKDPSSDFRKYCCSENNNNVFEVPINYFDEYKKLNNTMFICEDINDFKFYRNITNLFIVNVMKINNIKINLSFGNGGGARSEKVYEQYIKDKQIILVIADSDKRYPDDKDGQTLQKLRRIYSFYNSETITDLLGLSVREKENLIPPSIYLLSANGSAKKSLELLKIIENSNSSDILRFFDYKDGLSSDKIKNEGELNFFRDLILESHKQASSSKEQNLKTDLNKINFLIGGVGKKISEQFNCNFLEMNLNEELSSKSIKEELPISVMENLEKTIRVKEDLFDNLPAYIKPDLEKICLKVFSWGCASEFTAYG